MLLGREGYDATKKQEEEIVQELFELRISDNPDAQKIEELEQSRLSLNKQQQQYEDFMSRYYAKYGDDA